MNRFATVPSWVEAHCRLVLCCRAIPPSGYSLPVTQEDELLAWQIDVCVMLGVPWLPPKAKAGKPNRQALWLRATYAEVRAGRTSPDGCALCMIARRLIGVNMLI